MRILSHKYANQHVLSRARAICQYIILHLLTALALRCYTLFIQCCSLRLFLLLLTIQCVCADRSVEVKLDEDITSNASSEAPIAWTLTNEQLSGELRDITTNLLLDNVELLSEQISTKAWTRNDRWSNDEMRNESSEDALDEFATSSSSSAEQTSFSLGLAFPIAVTPLSAARTSNQSATQSLIPFLSSTDTKESNAMNRSLVFEETIPQKTSISLAQKQSPPGSSDSFFMSPSKFAWFFHFAYSFNIFFT